MRLSRCFLAGLGWLYFLLLCSQSVQAQKLTGMWATLGDVKWKNYYDASLGFEVSEPIFGGQVTALEGKDITIKGYVMPVDSDDNYMILSAFPYANCFFCGGAGPETVMEAFFPRNRRYYNKLVTVRGKLKLNRNDFFRLIYILEDAKVLSEE